MSFLAKLFLDNTERLVHNASVSFQQSVDFIGRPCTYPKGGLIKIKIDATHEDLFFDWAVSPTMMKEGYIRFYKTDGMSKFVDLEFWDCYCVEYSGSFTHNTHEAMFIDLVLSPGVIRYRDILFEKHWKVTDLNRATGEITALPIANEAEPQVLSCYFCDSEGNEIDQIVNEEKVILVLKTKNSIGYSVTVDLKDKRNDFKYKGQLLKNDILENITIEKDLHQIELEVIKPDEK